MITRIFYPASITVCFLAIIFLLTTSSVKANPSYFQRSAGTSSATTSRAYLTPGTGTTTETFNVSNGSSQAMDSATLYLFLIGSSTNPTVYATTTYNIAIEYSDNCIDWGGDTYIDGGATATTSQSQVINGSFTRQVTLPGLGTSIGGTLIATTTGIVRLLNVPTPTKCVRAVASIPAGSTNGSLWMQFVGKRELTY